MFTKRFMRSGHLGEGLFHDEMEQLMRDDPELEGRLSRPDAVAGGFDDLLHDDVIVELKVERQTTATVEHSAKYLGQPTQYGIGRGSQLSVLVVIDHTRKTSPPGVIENYIGWMQPRLHGLDDPSLVGVLVINTNLPVPSTWSRRRSLWRASSGMSSRNAPAEQTRRQCAVCTARWVRYRCGRLSTGDSGWVCFIPESGRH